jgi:hypothetical protein
MILRIYCIYLQYIRLFRQDFLLIQEYVLHAQADRQVYEYNLPFAHCGGSHDALDRIKQKKTMSLNEMINVSYYWIDPSIKVQEHSLYTSSDNMITLAKQKGFVSEPKVKFVFNKDYWNNLTTEAANSISIRFNSSYTTSYSFQDGLCNRSMNNKPTENKEDKRPVAVKNIVIQNVKYSTRPNETYLGAKLIGSVDGYIISNGKSVKVTRLKIDLKPQTIFKDESGKIVPLYQGRLGGVYLTRTQN